MSGGFQRQQQFQFQGNASVAKNLTSTHSAVQLPSGQGYSYQDVEVTNGGAKTAWIAFADTQAGAVAVAPTDAGGAASGYIILAGQTKVINVPSGQWMDGVTAGADTTTIYATVGQGA